jgi:hypothetical protein
MRGSLRLHFSVVRRAGDCISVHTLFIQVADVDIISPLLMMYVEQSPSIRSKAGFSQSSNIEPFAAK